MGTITNITGRALPLRGDDIDTDRIMPARFLRGVSFDGLEQHVFEDDRKKPMHPYNRHPFDVVEGESEIVAGHMIEYSGMSFAMFFLAEYANMWLVAILAPAEGGEALPEPILDPMANLVAAVSTQIFVVIAIFAVMSLIVSERESGTLAWTASKPVSRGAIWLAKWVSSTAMLGLLAGLVPLASTVVLVVVL